MTTAMPKRRKNLTALHRARGVRVRHSRSCKDPQGVGCPCGPSYRAWVSDYPRRIERTFDSYEAAREWRMETLRLLYERDVARRAKSGAIARSLDLDEAYSLVRRASVRADRSLSITGPPARAYVRDALDQLHRAEHDLLTAMVERS